jgi:hypothetical protein
MSGQLETSEQSQPKLPPVLKFRAAATRADYGESKANGATNYQ